MGGGGSLKPKNFLKCMKLNGISRGSGGLRKNLVRGRGMEIQ